MEQSRSTDQRNHQHLYFTWEIFIIQLDRELDIAIYSVFFYIGGIVEEKFEDTKGVIRFRKSKKNRQHNGQEKKYKRKNNDLHIHITVEASIHNVILDAVPNVWTVNSVFFYIIYHTCTILVANICFNNYSFVLN